MKLSREEYLAKKRASAAKYRSENAEKVKAAKREYYLNNKEKVLERRRQYVAQNLDMVRKKAREYNRENYEERAPLVKAWKEKNPERTRFQVHGMVFLPGQTIAGMVENQNGLCEICQRALPEGKHRHVDHDHDSGIVRAVLCKDHNIGLGLFQDSPELLRAAADYLERHRDRINALSAASLASSQEE
jgi:hypothetical protein